MEKLIEAFQIFLKYDNPDFPIQCEHHELWVVGNYRYDSMSNEDIDRLSKLGFSWDGHGFYYLT